MFRLVAVAILLAGCRYSLEDDDGSGNRLCAPSTTSVLCIDAVNHSDFAWIEKNIFAASCTFSGCHDTASAEGDLDLTPGIGHAELVDVSSTLEPTRKLVVPNDVAASYLMLMVRSVAPEMASPPGEPPPSDVDYMPQGQAPLCCQKLDVLERWIMAGAPND
jgi:hypothetical protein